MCTLCLSDMGTLRDEWLREPRRLPESSPAMAPENDEPMRALLTGISLPRPAAPLQATWQPA
jgi:hypothetical protein